MLNNELKAKIAAAVRADFENFAGSEAQHAVKMGISASVYSRLKQGNYEKIMADAKWISIARQLGVELTGASEWQAAQTPVYLTVQNQLAFCQSNATGAVLCDEAGIGKTFAALEYKRKNQNVIYVDCSINKSKAQLIRYMSRELGLDYLAKLKDVEADLVYYIKNALANPLVILDEAGDLHYEAFLELKALWNATENCCGWYMMGADCLRAKIERGIRNKKVGFAEIFDRLGAKAQKIVPAEKRERERFYATQAAMVVKANAPTDTPTDVVKQMILGADGHLRRVAIEIKKLAKSRGLES